MFLFEKVTIAPRAGRELGYVRMKMDHVKFKEGMLRHDFYPLHIALIFLISSLKNLKLKYQMQQDMLVYM